jgi:hypothetical protein
MRVLIMADELFATRERTLLTRLEVGLADEGIGAVHAIPEHAGELSPSAAFADSMTYPSDAPLLSRRRKARRMLARLEELGPTVDLIHVFGGAAWDDAMELGRLAGVPVAIELWRTGLIERARLIRTGREFPSVVILAPDAKFEEPMVGDTSIAPVRVAPWGVHVPGEPNDLLNPSRALSVFFDGPGRSPAEAVAALEGVVAAIPEGRDFHLFADAEGAQRAGLWRAAQQLGVLDRFSLIDEMEGRRELVLRGDVLVQADARGEQRSLVLDAMAAGMIVVAADDPMVSYLIDGRSARTVSGGHRDGWSAVLAPMLSEPATARDLAHRAREYVRTNHRVSAHVSAVLNAYEWVTSPEPIPFAER